MTKLELPHYYFPKEKRGPEASLPPTPTSMDGSGCCKGSKRVPVWESKACTASLRGCTVTFGV